MQVREMYIIVSLGKPSKFERLKLTLRGDVKKKNRIFKDIVQVGGGKVNPMSKIGKEMNFWQKLEREGVTKHIVKNRCTLFCMIYYSIWPNQLAFPSCVNENENAVLVIFKQVLEYWSDFARNITDRINTVRFLQILDG